jgi:hypothetical protein
VSVVWRAAKSKGDRAPEAGADARQPAGTPWRRAVIMVEHIINRNSMAISFQKPVLTRAAKPNGPRRRRATSTIGSAFAPPDENANSPIDRPWQLATLVKMRLAADFPSQCERWHFLQILLFRTRGLGMRRHP